MSNERAVAYLTQLIGKTLRITVTDNRMFEGQMKCTDRDRNVILALTHEYRPPSEEAIKKAIAESGSSSVMLPHSSRFMGLVVVPGEHITKIELEDRSLNQPPVL
ncbi:hypothetical protein H2201_006551 [Coniosporium apollinis]|uniref:Sm domain-containing protein n=2 Tax=Coniosporium TaxID=2810619 RepID=A0ABQ9NLL3_9PEZI|nr:hypothetical protein H2199_003785 [Cladosporium sp. JES 115]KAJ9661359.1 hypothetical protein H2201_006551 [Coniosporium apollinis]